MRTCVFSLALTLAVATGLVGAAPLGTAFTYQGRLTDGAGPATGTYDLQLVLYDALAGGSQVGPIVTRDDVAVANGLFTVSLDFGAVFTGNQRWLEIGVRPGAATGSYSVLSPRQELTPTPNAMFAANAATIGGLACMTGDVAKASGSTWTCGTDSNTTYSAGAGLTLASNQFSTDNTMVARKDAAAGNQAFDTSTLFLDYAGNRVGVGTASPAQALDVNGTTRSTNFTFNPAKTGTFRLSPYDFVADTTVNLAYSTLGYLTFAGATTSAVLYAKVQIPDGANITGASCDTWDNDAMSNFTVRNITLLRRVAGIDAIGSAGNATFGATSGASTTMIVNNAVIGINVDNDANYYHVYFTMTTSSTSADLRFYGCGVTYSTTAPAY